MMIRGEYLREFHEKGYLFLPEYFSRDEARAI